MLRLVGIGMLATLTASCHTTPGPSGQQPTKTTPGTSSSAVPPASLAESPASNVVDPGTRSAVRTVTPDEYIAMPPFTAKVLRKEILPLHRGKRRYHSAAQRGVRLRLLLDTGETLEVHYGMIDANWHWAKRLRTVEVGRRYAFAPREGPTEVVTGPSEPSDGSDAATPSEGEGRETE